ncbi:MAG: tail fiber domain-containing protein [Bdellovibrio sp.]
MKNFVILFSLLIGLQVHAVSSSPGSLFTYEGILTDAAGNPITNTQTVTFQVLYGSCILLEETQSITPGTFGEFSVIVGTGSRVDSTGNTADRIFGSSGSVNCKGASAVSLTGFATRSLHIIVGAVDLSPDVTIGNIPMAINSQKLGDRSATDFILVNAPSGVSQTNIENLFTRYTDLNNLLNAYVGNSLTAQSATSFSGALAGDITGAQGSTVISKLQGKTVNAASPTDGQVLKYVSNEWVPSTLTAGGTLSALTGDVSASGTGSVAATVNSVGGSTAANVHNAELIANAATNTNVASAIVKRDASGNFTAGTITANLTGAASANVLKSGDIMSGNLNYAANTGNTYTAGSGGNTVTLQGPSAAIGTSYILRLPAGQGAASQVMTNDGTGNLSWTSLSSLGVTSVSVTSPITNSGTLSAPNIGIQQATTSQSGYLSSSDWNTFSNKLGASLTSANLWVGNGSNVATAVTPSGDVSMTNTGAFTVTKLQSSSISAIAPTTAGQILRWSGSNWTPNFVSMFDLRSTITGTQAFGGVGCTAGQTLTWTAATDNLSCTNISLPAGQITGTIAASQMPAFVGDATSSAGSTALTLANSGVAAGTYKSVTVDTKGRVTGGTNPATLSAYGITDAIANLGGTPGIQTGVDAGKPASPSSGTIYFATDTLKIYQYNSSVWTLIASSAGAGGTVINVTGSAPISVANGTTTPVISLTGGSAAGQVFRWDGTSSWAATKLKYTDLINSLASNPWPATSCNTGQAVTWNSGTDSFTCTNIVPTVSGAASLADTKIWVGNASGKAQEVGISGDANLSNSGALTLAGSGVTAGTYKSVVVDAKGRVTSGTNPTTVAGYGITDAAILSGNPGGQILQGGVGPGESLTLDSTANATKGNLILNPAGGKVGIGTTSPSAYLTVQGAGTSSGQLQIKDSGYPASNPLSRSYIQGLDNTSSTVWYLGDSNPSTQDISFGTTASGYGLNLDTNGATRFRIQPDGSIGINTLVTNLNGTGTGPGTVTISGSGASAADTGYIELNNPMTPAAGTIGGKLSFNSSVNNGSKTLASIQSTVTGSGGTNGFGGQIIFSTKQDNNISVNMMIMNNLGNLGVGLAPAYKLDVNGDANLSTGSVFRIAGTQICSGTGCTSSSDRRLKENIQPLSNSLEKILQINGVEYDYKDKAKFSDKHQIGVIAQDVEKVFPEVVITDSKTTLKSVAYDHLVAPIIESIKALYGHLIQLENKQHTQARQIASKADQTEVAILKAEGAAKDQRIQNLEQENAEIKARLEKIEKALQSK